MSAGIIRTWPQAIIALLVCVGVVIGLVSVLKQTPAGRPPEQEASVTRERPRISVFKECPLAEIDGKLIPLGQKCMYQDGELVGVQIKAGGGWVMAE